MRSGCDKVAHSLPKLSSEGKSSGSRARAAGYKVKRDVVERRRVGKAQKELLTDAHFLKEKRMGFRRL